MPRNPFNTCALAPALTADNCDMFLQALKNAKPGLFRSQGTTVQLESIRVNADDPSSHECVSDLVTKDGDVESVLRKHLEYQGDTFIYLFQDHSWAPFNLSEEALRKVVTVLGPRPEFLKLFNGLGHPSGGYETDFSGGYDCHVETSDSGQDGIQHHDFTYTLRHVAATGRSQCPWSERRMGVYHRVDSTKAVWVILQPTPAALTLPQVSMNALCSSDRTTLPHVLLFRSALPAWTAYLKYLEALVRENSRAARLPGQDVDLELAFTSVQNLQYYSDLLHNAISHLRSNKEVLTGLQSLAMELGGSEIPSVLCRLRACVSQFGMDLHWAEDMLDRAKQVSNLASFLLYSKHNRILRVSTAQMTDIARATKSGQDIMLTVTRATNGDSGVMRIVAIISMAFLPLSLVTGLFSTSFVTANLTSNMADGSSRANVSMQALIYAVVSLSLTAVTGIAAYIWHNRNASRP